MSSETSSGDPTPAPPIAPTPRNYTPHAILGGSVIVAIGLYFGLRREPPPAAPPPSSSTAALAVSSSSAAPFPAVPSSAVPVAPAPTPSARADAAIDEDVAKAIEELRARAAKECWAPHKSDPGVPSKVKLVYSGSFDAGGTEVARGLSEDRAAAAPVVAACIRAFKMDLKIPAPGRYVNATVPFEVP